MGAWGTGNFDNDSALDFVAALCRREDGCELLATTLEFALGDEDQLYIGASGYSKALAAAEVVAALCGAPAVNLRAEVADWAWYRRPVEPETLERLAQLAGEVVRRIRDDSELCDLWSESDSNDQWRAVVDELATRLEEVSVEDILQADEQAPSPAEKFFGPWDLAVELDLEQAVTPVEHLLVEYVVADPDQNVLYLTSDFPLTALDLDTGQIRWQSYAAARPLMLLGDVLLAQASPARLPFKNLHLVLLDRATGDPLQTFKVRFDEMLVASFVEKDGYVRSEARLVDDKIYVTWESGIYPPSDARSPAANDNLQRSQGAVCFDPARNQLAVVDHDLVPPEELGERTSRHDLLEIAQVDLASALGGPYMLAEEVAVLTRASSSPARTPEARRRPGGQGGPGGTGGVVMQRWDAHTGKRRNDVTLVARAGADVAVGASLDRQFIWVREQDPTATPACRHHIFDAATYQRLVCIGTDKDLGSLSTRLGGVFIFGHYVPVLHGVDADTGEVLWEYKLR